MVDILHKVAEALQPRRNPTAGAVVLIDSFSEPGSS
jgi:hypothetical protein